MPGLKRAWPEGSFYGSERLADDAGELDGRAQAGVGAIRDVIENHLFQVLTLLAMDPFPGHHDDALRKEKARFLRGVRALRPQDVIRGQYRGYRQTDGVAPDSKVETYAAMRLRVDTWRWADVPILVRAGKQQRKAIVQAFEILRPLFTNVAVSTSTQGSQVAV